MPPGFPEQIDGPEEGGRSLAAGSLTRKPRFLGGVPVDQGGCSKTGQVFTEDGPLGFVQLGELIEDGERGGVKAAGPFAVTPHLVKHSEMTETQTDFGMCRSKKLFPDSEGLHVALLGTKQVATLAEYRTEIAGNKSGLPVRASMAMRGLVKGAPEQDSSFLQVAAKLSQHGEIVQAEGHAVFVAGQLVKIGGLGVVSTGTLRIAQTLLNHGQFCSHARRIGRLGPVGKSTEGLGPAGKSFALITARGGFVTRDLQRQGSMIPLDILG